MKKKCALVFPAIRLLLFLPSLFISHLAAAGPTYSVTDLGQVNPTAINDAGQVTGYTGYTGDAHAFLYSNGILSDLGTLGGNISHGFGINSFGHVVGSSRLEPQSAASMLSSTTLMECVISAHSGALVKQ